eukprot:scaffold672_cov268-Pinguiococcus_pyrenoidosus.AAC.5
MSCLAPQQGRFQQMSETIVGRIDEMGARIDDLEKCAAGNAQDEMGCETARSSRSSRQTGRDRGAACRRGRPVGVLAAENQEATLVMVMVMVMGGVEHEERQKLRLAAGLQASAAWCVRPRHGVGCLRCGWRRKAGCMPVFVTRRRAATSGASTYTYSQSLAPRSRVPFSC